MSECILKVNKLTKCYNNVKVLDEVDLIKHNNEKRESSLFVC